MPPSFTQHRCSLIEQICFFGQDSSNPLNLLIGFLPSLLLDRFSDPRDRLHTVSRIEPWGIDHVPEPGSAWPSSGIRQPAFALNQLRIDRPHVGRIRLLPRRVESL